MKLKYYMRGLGIGIILTTLILTIGGKKLSDQEIKERAVDLGMVMKDEADEDLEKVLESDGISPSLSIAPSESPTQEATISPTTEPTVIPTPTVTPTLAVTPTVKPTSKPTATPTMKASKDTSSKDDIAFSVKSGMSSGQVAKLLLEKGLIDDSEKFNRYIVKVRKASIIRVGEYTLPKGSNYDEIIAVITTR